MHLFNLISANKIFLFKVERLCFIPKELVRVVYFVTMIRNVLRKIREIHFINVIPCVVSFQDLLANFEFKNLLIKRR